MLTRLPHRVVIMTQTRTTFSGGAYTTSWTTDSTEWANCQQVSAVETYENAKQQQTTKWKIVMRSGAMVTNKKRIVYASKNLVVENVIDPINRSHMQVVMCREEVV